MRIDPSHRRPRRDGRLATVLLALGALLALAGAAPAAGEPELPQRLVLDTDTSHVDFTLGATLHTVEGSFRVSGGEIGFDPVEGTAGGRVVIDARSGDTGSERRDRNMHRDVLESDTYPEFVFLPERLAVLRQEEDEAEVELAGTVEIHGVRKPLTIPATVRREGDALRIRGAFTVPYVDWGLRDYSNFVLRVAPTVDVQLDVVGRLQPERRAAAP